PVSGAGGFHELPAQVGALGLQDFAAGQAGGQALLLALKLVDGAAEFLIVAVQRRQGTGREGAHLPADNVAQLLVLETQPIGCAAELLYGRTRRAERRVQAAADRRADLEADQNFVRHRFFATLQACLKSSLPVPPKPCTPWS